MENVLQFLKDAKVYYLGTVDGDQPKIRPFGTVCMYEDKLYIITSAEKDVSKQLHVNPKAEIVACKENGQWIRITCELVVDDRPEPQEAMLNEYPNLRNLYKVGDGNTKVFYMKNAKALFISFARVLGEVEF